MWNFLAPLRPAPAWQQRCHKMTAMAPLLLRALLFCLLCAQVTAEIRKFDGLIEAASNFIHYSDGYLVAPGYVDISGLTFSTLEYVPDEELNDDALDGDEDDDVRNDDGGGGGGDRRVLDESDQGSDGSVVSG